MYDHKKLFLRARQNAAHINQYVGKDFGKLSPNGLHKSTFPQIWYGQGYSYLADSHAWIACFRVSPQ